MRQTLTGDKLRTLSHTQCIVLLWVQCDGVLRIRLQVEEGVLSQAARQAQLFGVW